MAKSAKNKKKTTDSIKITVRMLKLIYEDNFNILVRHYNAIYARAEIPTE